MRHAAPLADTARFRYARPQRTCSAMCQSMQGNELMKIDASIAAIVTGGASGLGEGSARRLAADGAKVAIFDMNAERGEMVAKEIGGVFCQVNVADEASVDAGFAKARAAHGQERVFVNCAGIGWAEKTARRSSSTGEIAAHSFAGFSKVISINLIGSFICAAKSAAGMMSLDPNGGSGRGVIINTASVAAQDGQIGQVAYAASKGGIYGMTLPMARDLAREGIRVNTILPGFFETPIYQQMPPEVKVSLASHLQFPQRFGTPAEYADLVAFMVTSDYINAECVRLDAGARMPPK